MTNSILDVLVGKCGEQGVFYISLRGYHWGHFTNSTICTLKCGIAKNGSFFPTHVTSHVYCGILMYALHIGHLTRLQFQPKDYNQICLCQLYVRHLMI